MLVPLAAGGVDDVFFETGFNSLCLVVAEMDVRGYDIEREAAVAYLIDDPLLGKNGVVGADAAQQHQQVALPHGIVAPVTECGERCRRRGDAASQEQDGEDGDKPPAFVESRHNRNAVVGGSHHESGRAGYGTRQAAEAPGQGEE